MASPIHEEQDRLLEEAKNVIKVQAFHMKRCLDNAKIMDALKHASYMISELRTSVLSPKTYYSLYMMAFDELRHLESFLTEEKHGKSMQELYELVQYAGNILPRLYLLVTVGSVYIKSKGAPAKDVLRDLVEMCRGVQHPTRGLFLRSYLLEMTKDKLPDEDSEYEGAGGDIHISIEYIIQNFVETNKLWVRMQHQGHNREKERRESERMELRLLVGKNLATLSQLEGVNISIYNEDILPKLVEQIISCKDKMAQQYLMEILIQVFPDDFHLKTLPILLDTCGKLQATVDIRTIVSSLIDRLASFAAIDPSNIPEDVQIFQVFNEHIGKVIEQFPSMSVADILGLQVSLQKLSLECYPDNLDYIDDVLSFCCSQLTSLADSDRSGDLEAAATVVQIKKLLSSPLESLQDVRKILQLEHYATLLNFLNYDNRKMVSVDILTNAQKHSTEITEEAKVNSLYTLVSSLIYDDDKDGDNDLDEEDFAEEQNCIGKTIHLFQSHKDDPSKLFLLFTAAKSHLFDGGLKRMKISIPPLIFRVIDLAVTLSNLDVPDAEKKIKKIFQLAHEMISHLAKSGEDAKNSKLCLYLFLQAAQASDRCSLEAVTYEFMSKAFEIYEEDISDSKAQFHAINLIVNTLGTLKSFEKDNYDTLRTKSAIHSSKLLKKEDQCKAVYNVSHLFWPENQEYQEGNRVLECLQKSLKIADACMDSAVNVKLFVEILNKYLFFYEQRISEVTEKYISSLIALINTNITSLSDDNPQCTPIQNFYSHTLKMIKTKKEANDDLYQQVEVK